MLRILAVLPVIAIAACSPWLWAPNTVTVALDLASAASSIDSDADNTPPKPSRIGVTDVDFSAFGEQRRSAPSWADGLD